MSVLAAISSAHTQAIVNDFRREALVIDVVTLAALDSLPATPVYLVAMDPSMITELGARCVAWAATAELRSGLIGIIENGDHDAIEALLATGFDDVVASPASSRELVARVRAVHRRVHWKGISNGRLRFGDLTLDLYGRELWIDGKTIALTSIELAVLRELIKARGKPLSRAELLDLAWGEGDLEVSERAVDNVILRLRRKLPSPDLIETVRSVGFRIADRS
ncbi:MAG TPA: response regulator transcription factor [Kofleriaceae bacterium]